MKIARLILALSAAGAIAACDSEPPAPRTDSSTVAAPGPVARGANDPGSPAATSAKDTPSAGSAPAAPSATPSQSGGHGAVASGDSPVASSNPGASGTTAGPDAQGGPAPKQNNDHSIPSTVRAPIGEAGSVAAQPHSATDAAPVDRKATP
jgi:hypothetical protein